MSDHLLIERDGAVVTLTLNRPQALNALNTELKNALRAAVAGLSADRTCRAVVLAGAGRAFCVGQDLHEHERSLEEHPGPGALSTVVEHYNPLVLAIADLGKPVIAAVRGTAAGAGASLAFLADLRIGGPRTSFLTAFAGIGLAADTGASWTLPRIVGQARAAELLLLNDPVDAAEAYRWGLLNRLVDDDEKVLPAAQELAARLAAGPTLAYAQIKRELQVSVTATLAESLDAEAHAQAVCADTADHRNATVSFVRKERPVFHGE